MSIPASSADQLTPDMAVSFLFMQNSRSATLAGLLRQADVSPEEFIAAL
jgi:hypothetical protein